MKSLKNIVFVIFILSLTSTAFSQGPVLVSTEKTVQMKFNNQIRLIGRTKGIIESEIAAEISGRVSSIQVLEGSKVSLNQTLVSIDSEPLSLALQAKQAEALQAREKSTLATDTKTLALKLIKENLISESGLDSAVAWDAIQMASFQKAEAEQRQLEIDFANTKIKAPFAGYTGRRLVDVGSWVTPGLPIFEMVDISTIKITVDLPERYFGQLKIGSSVTIIPSTQDISLSGKVVGISPSATKETHTYPVIIEVPNKDEILASGMLVQVKLFLIEEFNSIAVNKDAIVRQGGNTIVYTIEDGKASLVPVTITSSNGTMVAVQSPILTESMEVIVRGNERIYPGAAVMTGNEKPTEEKPEESQAETEN